MHRAIQTYLIEHLPNYGSKDIMVNVAHIHRKIEQYFGDGRRWGAQIGYVYGEVQAQGAIIPKPFGSAGGLGSIQDFSRFFDEAALVRCGDLEIGAALHEHKTTGAIAKVVTPGVPLADVQSYGIVVIEGNGQIQSFQEYPRLARPNRRRPARASTFLNPKSPKYCDPTRCTPFARNCFHNW